MPLNILYAMLFDMLRKRQEKLCKSDFISKPRRQWRAGGRQRHASAVASLRWQDSDETGTAEWPPA